MELKEAMQRLQETEAALEGALERIKELEIELEEAQEVELRPPIRLGLNEDDAT